MLKHQTIYFFRKVTLFIIFVCLFSYYGISEAVAWKCSVKKAGWPVNLLKKRVWHRCFPVNFVKFLRKPLLTEHLRWLLLVFPGIVLRNRVK